ncbi:CPBP family intramembrane glutamic endopeptidase [Actinoplanes sp. NPDC020271]|uniref:CPBP family intramembrane glutamic endopeptidase n=1 Tax=Actinoplanes sp. NPDC020271 TaxID=3363896 RepID=UPI0037B87B51
MISESLSVALIVALAVDAGVGTARTKRALAAADRAPARRVSLYRRFIAIGWGRAAVATLVAIGTGLSPTGLGLSPAGGGPATDLPGGALLAWVAAAGLSIASGIGAVRVRRKMRAGKAYPQRAKVAALVPRTGPERWYAAGVAVTAGVTEEIAYRGALIGLGVHVFGLPAPAAAGLSLVLFAAAHAYQGRMGVMQSAFLGFYLSGMTLLAGNIFPAMLLHVAVDLCSLLVVPAPPASPAPHDAQREPAAAGQPDGSAAPTGTTDLIRSPAPE